MKATEGKLGRVLLSVWRMETGYPICIERFAEEKGSRPVMLFLWAGHRQRAGSGGAPQFDRMPPDPMLLPVDGAHEAVGVGTAGSRRGRQTRLHIHAALGRSGQTLTGCLRPGVDTWLVGEVIIYEITGADAKRVKDPAERF